MGAEEHAAQFEAFLEQALLSPELLHRLANLAEPLMPHFEEQNAAFIALDEETALTSIIYRHISTEE